MTCCDHLVNLTNSCLEISKAFLEAAVRVSRIVASLLPDEAMILENLTKWS